MDAAAEARAMRAVGHSYSTIGRKLGISHDTAWRWSRDVSGSVTWDDIQATATERRDFIWSLWQGGHTRQEIADRVNARFNAQATRDSIKQEVRRIRREATHAS